MTKPTFINQSINSMDDMKSHIIAQLSAGRRYQTDDVVFDLIQHGPEYAFVSSDEASREEKETRYFIDLRDADMETSDDERGAVFSDAKAETGEVFRRSTHMPGTILLDLLKTGLARIATETKTEQRGPRTKTVTRYYVVAA